MLFVLAAALAAPYPSLHAEKVTKGRWFVTDRIDERVDIGRNGSDAARDDADGLRIDAVGPGGVVTEVIPRDDLNDPARVRAAFDLAESVLYDLPVLLEAAGIDLCRDVAELGDACDAP